MFQISETVLVTTATTTPFLVILHSVIIGWKILLELLEELELELGVKEFELEEELELEIKTELELATELELLELEEELELGVTEELLDELELTIELEELLEEVATCSFMPHS